MYGWLIPSFLLAALSQVEECLPTSYASPSARTFTPLQPVPYAISTVPEFRLGSLQLLEGGREVLQLLRELVLDLVELLSGEGVEVDWARGSAFGMESYETGRTKD